MAHFSKQQWNLNQHQRLRHGKGRCCCWRTPHHLCTCCLQHTADKTYPVDRTYSCGIVNIRAQNPDLTRNHQKESPKGQPTSASKHNSPVNTLHTAATPFAVGRVSSLRARVTQCAAEVRLKRILRTKIAGRLPRSSLKSALGAPCARDCTYRIAVLSSWAVSAVCCVHGDFTKPTGLVCDRAAHSAHTSCLLVNSDKLRRVTCCCFVRQKWESFRFD